MKNNGERIENMGKKRNTAKTGDKALYNSRGKDQDARNKNNKSDDDANNRMYNEIDRFHNEQDQNFIRLGAEEEDNDDDEDKDLAGNQISVLDLGAGGMSSSEDDDDDDDDDDSSSDDEDIDNRNGAHSSSDDGTSDEDDDNSDSDDDDEEDYNMKQGDPRNWGKKKSLYYHGDTADLEIGQEEDDAFLEEEAAKEIQATRFGDMKEDDFVLSEDENDEKDIPTDKDTLSSTVHEKLQTIRDTSRLTKKETRRIIDKKYPELLPMVSYFSDIVKDLKDRTQIATNALMEGEGTAESIGATTKGQQYLLTKSMLQKSIALNSVVYILLRYASAGDDDATINLQAHPVMDQLKKFDSLLKKLEENVHHKSSNIELQLDNLIKAAALMTNNNNASGIDSSDDDDDVSKDRVTIEEVMEDDDSVDDSSQVASDISTNETDVTKKSKSIRQVQKVYEHNLNDARFGLRSKEVNESSSYSQKKRRMHHLEDFGDIEEDEYNKTPSNLLASTINTIEQRHLTASRKRRKAPVAEQLDDLDEHDDELAQGIKMMEEELGKIDDDDKDIHDDGNDMTAPDADNDNDNDELLGFYNKISAKSREKKSFKKNLYKVAPKFPVVEGEIAGERAISRTILKNRGLVAHKAKINRNPRVKKREQYRKALIRRKGTVREVREEEGHKYGGEETGIKSGISRSRKLA